MAVKGRATYTGNTPFATATPGLSPAEVITTPKLTAVEQARLKGTTLNSVQSQTLTALTDKRTSLENSIRLEKLTSIGMTSSNRLKLLEISLKKINDEISRLVDTIGIVNAPLAKTEPESAVQSSQAAAKIIVKTDKVTPNLLHAYPSYTYGLSLHLLTTDSYNEIVNQGTYTAKHVLVASAGRYNPDVTATGASAFSRDPEFTDDFYFSNLQMSTIIGMGISNRGTNAISMDFTLIEPYGLTFLDRLLAASNALGIENYLANPYLLQIDFFGATDDSTLLHPIPNISKHIPINILALDIKVTGQGSEYKITAQPFNHQAFNETIVSTPISVEVIAGTVGGFFKSSESLTAEVEKQYRADDNIAYPVSEAAAASAGTGSLYSSYSYADVLNAHSKKLELTKGIQANRYYFNFDSRIGDSLLFTGSDDTDGTTTSNTEVPMFDSSTAYVKSKINDEKNSNGKLYADGLKYELRKFPITQGDSIESIIAMVVRDSAYILSQLTIDDINNAAATKEKKKQNEDRTLGWLKIIPKIELKGYDPFTNAFIKTITYNVVPYTMNNVRHPAAPQGKATIINASKQYNYIYTGKNDDILDLNIEFNTTYYTALTSYNSNLMKISGVDNGFYNTSTSCDIRAPNNANNSVTLTPNQIVYKPTDQTQMGSSGAKTPLEETAAEVASSVYTRSGADMISVSLKIVGDPAFIKQDDIFYQPAFGSDGQVLMPTMTPNGSIITDNGEVFVTISFLTPKDIDDNTGLMELKSKYQVSGFSGLYRIIQVDSQFESGKFTQTLQLIRYPNQDISNTTVSSAAERENVDTQQQLQSTPVPPTSTGGVTPVVTAEVDDNTAKAKEEPVADGDTKKIDPKLAAIKDAALTVAMDETNAPVAIPVVAKLNTPSSAVPGSPLAGISAADLQFLRNEYTVLGIKPTVIDNLLLTPLSYYDENPTLKAKILSDVATIKTRLAAREAVENDILNRAARISALNLPGVTVGTIIQ